MQTVYSNSDIKIEVNSSGEAFITNIHFKTSLRVTSESHGMLFITAQSNNSFLIPSVKNGKAGMSLTTF